MSHWEREATRLLCRQQHVISLAQAKACGATRGAVDAKVRVGAWDRVATGIYRPSGAEGGWEQAIWIAHLVAGPTSIVSHESAGQLHGLRGVRRGRVTLTVPPDTHPRVAGARFTMSTELAAAHRTMVNGLPVTSPAWTIVDLAGRPDVSVARLDAILVGAETGLRRSTR